MPDSGIDLYHTSFGNKEGLCKFRDWRTGRCRSNMNDHIIIQSYNASQVVVWYSAILTIRSSLRTAMGENPILPIQVPEIRSG